MKIKAPGNCVTKPTKKEKRDDSIMNTNNSSIVSKRSVEKLYHKSDDGFLRYFVTKFQRRSPLINRGYWLRMKAIEHVLRQFLQETPGIKIIVSLGSGYDPIAFKLLARDPELCKHAMFVDIDYRPLILKKCDIIRSTPQLSRLVPDSLISSAENAIILQSHCYSAIGCDLQDIEVLDRALRKLVDVDDVSMLFVAEVSMTYMDVEAADAVIKWAARISHSRFCLLEQLLPDGPDHPFADTMLKHFTKLSSSLKSVLKYPSLGDQQIRFTDAGWLRVCARTLWDLWSDDTWVSCDERRDMDNIEPFDEWEEFALFSCHYSLVIADNFSHVSESAAKDEVQDLLGSVKLAEVEPNVLSSSFAGNPKGKGLRRYGATIKAGANEIFHHGGHGTRGRLNTYDLITRHQASKTAHVHARTLRQLPGDELMCHTITSLQNGDGLLVGGRNSPDHASTSCFLGTDGRWTKVDDLPQGLYRHCAVPVEIGMMECRTSTVLVFGGKVGSHQLSDQWLFWQLGRGWKGIEVFGGRPCPRFGACMTLAYGSKTKGFLTGGINQRGKVITDLWNWELVQNDGITKVKCVLGPQVSGSLRDRSFGRFGARLVDSPRGLLLIGGISGTSLIERRNEVLVVNRAKMQIWDDTTAPVTLVESDVLQFCIGPTVPRPLLVGFAVEIVDYNQIVIVGGGAVCFSFGTCWNEGCYTLAFEAEHISVPWHFTRPEHVDFGEYTRTPSDSSGSIVKQSTGRGVIVPRVEIQSAEEFKRIVVNATPIIIENLNIGACTHLWNDKYLKRQIGEDRPIVVHSAQSSDMNFLAKNFTYTRKSFGQFLDEIERGEKMYMRALSTSQPAEKPTTLREDFPTIAADFQLPPELAYAETQMHSSPLRISGPVSMWLHYDVMANILCQVRGKKRLLLYPPSDVTKLEFPPGASSSRLNVFDPDPITQGLLSQVHPHDAVLKSGDVLFIPALWPHSACPIDSTSIAVNVFFRNLSSGYAAGSKDVYGNRDLQAYEMGRRDVQKISKAFKDLPRDVGRFYLERLAGELAEIAASWR